MRIETTPEHVYEADIRHVGFLGTKPAKLCLTEYELRIEADSLREPIVVERNMEEVSGRLRLKPLGLLLTVFLGCSFHFQGSLLA